MDRKLQSELEVTKKDLYTESKLSLPVIISIYFPQKKYLYHVQLYINTWTVHVYYVIGLFWFQISNMQTW